MRSQILAILAYLLILLTPANSHGPAEWIQRGDHRNTAGEACCGERDCIEIAGEHVKAVRGGYRVILGEDAVEIVPYSESQPSQPSPDGAFWRCQWGGMRKCFFAPPPAM